MAEHEPDVGKIRELIDHVLRSAELEPDELTISYVLLVLSSHNLLRGFPGTPAEYHSRVQRAYSDSLRLLFGEEPRNHRD
jgi:hypothetical protein